MSPKKGSMAAKNVAMITDNDRKINLDITLRMEKRNGVTRTIDRGT
jgi:hypothetical protein